MKEIIFLRKPRQNLRKHVHEGNVLKNKIINELRKIYCSTNKTTTITVKIFFVL